MLKISVSFFMADLCLSTSVASGLVWVGLRRACVRSVDVCIVASSDDVLGKGGFAGKNSIVSET